MADFSNILGIIKIDFLELKKENSQFYSICFGLIFFGLFTFFLFLDALDASSYKDCLVLTAAMSLIILIYQKVKIIKWGDKSVYLYEMLDDANSLLFDVSKIMLSQIYSIDRPDQILQAEAKLRLMSPNELHRIRNEIFDTQKDKLHDLEKIEFLLAMRDYFFLISQILINQNYYQEISMEDLAAIKNKLSEKAGDIDTQKEIERITSKMNIENAYFKSVLVAYKYYAENKKHKDIDLWINRDGWYGQSSP